MKIEKNIQFILLLLIIMYFSQGIVFEIGSIISQVVLLIILSISIIYFIKTLTSNVKKPLFYKVWTILFLANVFLYIFTGDFSNALHFSKLKGILIIALPFYPFYYFAENGVLKAKQMMWLFVIMLPIVIIQFYLERLKILSMRSWDNENVVNNVSYLFVFLTPFLFFFKKKKILSIIAALVLMFFILQGAKRGAIIASGIGLLFFAYHQLKIIDKKNKFKGYIFAIGSIAALAYFGYDYYQNNEFLIHRMESLSEGNSSGRTIIYANIFNAWYNSHNILNILFGFGFGSSLILSGTGNWAHNDWLEGLAGFGLIGVALYLWLFFAAFRLIYTKGWSNDKKILLLSIVSVWFVTTLVSMNYYNATDTMFQYIVLAYLVGSKTNKIE